MANPEPQSPEWYRQMLTAAELRMYELIRRGKAVPDSLLREIELLSEKAANADGDVILTDVKSGFTYDELA